MKTRKSQFSARMLLVLEHELCRKYGMEKNELCDVIFVDYGPTCTLNFPGWGYCLVQQQQLSDIFAWQKCYIGAIPVYCLNF